MMASKPYPPDSAYCGAKLDGLITPYVDNKPRPDMAYRETVYCDLPRSHAFSPTVGRRWHHDRGSGRVWWDAEGLERR